MNKSRIFSFVFRSLACLMIFFVFILAAAAQSEDELKEALVKSLILMKAGKPLEAEPYLAKLVKAVPDSAELRVLYGSALLTKSKQINDNEEAKKAAALALEQFQAAKRLGSDEAGLDEMIKALGGDPTNGGGAKENKDASAFDQAEIKFAQSKFDEALVLYRKALEENPKNYEAALYSADCLMQLKDYENAEKFYQKAIAIDPERETAYRYSATYLMKQKKYDEARDCYINAVIAEPYNEMSYRGIEQWANVTGGKLSHPDIDYPKDDETLDAASPWSVYRSTRNEWKNKKFAEAYPSEKDYRHSIKEEVEALRALIKANDGKRDKKQFETLQRLESEGLLEAYVFFAHSDSGVATDYKVYRKDNQPKLRQYFLNYVILK
jgi:tetratricopeptide (TPR) repeat protein